MTGPMENKTPEQRKAMTAKGVATRKANRQARKLIENELMQQACGLRQEIALLEAKLTGLKRMECINGVSAQLTGKALLREEDIAKNSLPYGNLSGIYFLLDGGKVVYVGQSVNIHSRIAQHTGKRFDRYAYVPCKVESLDILESLYIHFLQPKLNGNVDVLSGAKCAPIALNALISIS